jgi:uncharacterized protein with HEPN domain
MSSEPLEYLRHILAEADYLMAQREGLTFETFVASDTLRRAFVRSLEVIGEATKKIPAAFRSAHPAVEWRSMSGMRHDVFGAQAHRRSVEDRFGEDYDIPEDLPLGSLRLLSLPVALWPTDGPPPWIRSSRGALVIESPQRARLERFVVRENAPLGWVVSVIHLCGRSAQIAGFERPSQLRRRFGLDLPVELSRPFHSCAAAQAAVEASLSGRSPAPAPVPPARERRARELEEQIRRYKREGDELAPILDFDGRQGRAMRDRALPFWTPPAPSRRPPSPTGRTRFTVANGAVLLTATVQDGDTVCFRQLVFGHGFYDLHIRTGVGKACMERCERVLNSFAKAAVRSQPVAALSDRELGNWVNSALDKAGIAQDPCPLADLI